jgi:putative copper resistance protein D
VIDSVFWVLVAARWAQFIAVFALFGGCLFPLYVFAKEAPPIATIAEPARRIMTFAASAAVISAAVWVLASVANLADHWGGILDGEILADYFLETSFGFAWIIRLILAGALFVVVLFSKEKLFARNGPTRLVVVLAATLLMSQAWIGHPAAATGTYRWIFIGAYALHVLGVGAWLGGLVPLSLTLLNARSRNAAAKAVADKALRRFSTVGTFAVVMIFAGGAVNAWSRIGSFHAFVLSSWGWVLTFKILLFLAMIAVATINRFVLMPRIRSGADAAFAAIARNVAIEQAGGAALLALAATLGILAPPG